MSGAAGIENIYSAIEESARLLGTPCSRDKVWPILTAYGDALTEVAIIFSVSTGSQEFDYTIQVPSGIDDPYAHAVSHGLVAEADHPAGSLLSDIQARVPVSEYFSDYGVVGGFQKLYASFPKELQAASSLADIPSMPDAVAENLDLFTRYDLGDVALVGIDYKRKTMNLYFQLPTAVAGDVEPKLIRSLLGEIGMPDPDEQMLETAVGAYRVYVTLSWESLKVERISFAPRPTQGLDLSAIQARLEPRIKQFMSDGPYAYAEERVSISVPKWTPDGSHFNLGYYYQISPQLRAIIATHGS
ncbi:aromatic prenyltransferase [Actinomadura sp. 9N215]|uniref:aromatic prenyltransferase n=1 Tax=Actinomadura sp. 9N215 TaxID=3375150 RepID=UPI003799F802